MALDPKDNHKHQTRVAGQFAANPDKPGKKPLSLRVEAGLLSKYKSLKGKGFSGELAEVVEEFMRSQLTEHLGLESKP